MSSLVRLAPESRIAAAIFLAVAAVLFATHGNRMVFTNDEGILLMPAQHVAQGAAPYVDFFGYMSPGSYWLQAIVFRVLGLSLWAGRVPVLIGFALQCALVFWIGARLSSRVAAGVVTFAFFGFQVADATFLTAQHRWDSATLVLLGLCLLLRARDSQTAGAWHAGAGALMGAAAWCTPSMGLAIVAAAGWIAWGREWRKHALPFLAGVAGVCAAAIATLAAQGAWQAFAAQMLWLQKNYAAVNIMPYGAMIGGLDLVLKDAQGAERGLLYLLVTCVELPAILPPAALLLWGVAAWRRKVSPGERRELALLLVAMPALVLTAFPRADVMHLAFVAALPYALAGAAVSRLLPARAAGWFAMTALVLPALFAFQFFRPTGSLVAVASPAGTLRIEPKQAAAMRDLLARVPAGESLYVHPYMPVFYFVTQTRNPTQFPYLAPGMMTVREEEQALQELRAAPPAFLMHLALSREEFLRVFPSATHLDHRFRAVEQWIEEHYQPAEPPVVVAGYRLMTRRHATVSQVSRRP